MQVEKERNESLVLKINHYLWNCPLRDLSGCNCRTLAEDFELHPVVLSRRFSREFGRPLVNLLREVKVTRAVGVLRDGTVSSVSEAMSAVGYRDRKYFAYLVMDRFKTRLSELES